MTRNGMTDQCLSVEVVPPDFTVKDLQFSNVAEGRKYSVMAATGPGAGAEYFGRPTFMSLRRLFDLREERSIKRMGSAAIVIAAASTGFYGKHGLRPSSWPDGRHSSLKRPHLLQRPNARRLSKILICAY
jgi:hypothetical protein